MEQEIFRKLIADNIAYYRKRNNLTQLELAEKLNYSDKAVSKWERGDGIPDVCVLQQMAEIFGITLNDFTAEPRRRIFNDIKRNKVIVGALSVAIAWLVATIIFVTLSIAAPLFEYKWMVYIYVLPVSAIIALVFSCIWGGKVTIFLSTSGVIWTTILAIFLSINRFFPNTAYLFFVGIPLQIMAFMWIFRKKSKIPKGIRKTANADKKVIKVEEKSSEKSNEQEK